MLTEEETEILTSSFEIFFKPEIGATGAELQQYPLLQVPTLQGLVLELH